MKHKDLVKRNIGQLNSMKFQNADWQGLIDVSGFDVKPISPDNIEITYLDKNVLSKYMCAILCASGCIITFPFNNINRLKNRIKYYWNEHGFIGYLIAEVLHENKR